MDRLENWLRLATRRLSTQAAAQVRGEISEHYDLARQAAIQTGVSADEADRVAVASLGDPKTANCQYCKVLLTSTEARLLADGDAEARLFCSRPVLKRVFRAAPVLTLLGAAALYQAGETGIARVLLAAAVGLALIFATPMLPLYTPRRSRVYRVSKWAALLGVCAIAFGPQSLQMSWLWIPCMWPVVWIEYTRSSIRRKLPDGSWPKHLYL